jgi:ethanolamine utilization microcompartment shell protein EutS
LISASRSPRSANGQFINPHDAPVQAAVAIVLMDDSGSGVLVIFGNPGAIERSLLTTMTEY